MLVNNIEMYCLYILLLKLKIELSTHIYLWKKDAWNADTPLLKMIFYSLIIVGKIEQKQFIK